MTIVLAAPRLCLFFGCLLPSVCGFFAAKMTLLEAL
jgi:hypothetical protein